MEPGDPFGSLREVCQMSSSEESRLRRCFYFCQSDSDDSNHNSGWRNPLDIPLASTSITMVSPPESQEDELPNDQYTFPEDQEIFHTPLDCHVETEAVDVDSGGNKRAVDLGKDTNLGFSEVEVDSKQRIEANSSPDGMFRRESEEIRVSKRRFSPKGQSSTESPSKKLKSLDFESPSVRLGTPKERKRSLPSWADSRMEGDKSVCEELEINETEFPSWTDGRVADDERTDKELDVNEKEMVHLDTDSDSLSGDFEEFTLLDVLMKLEEDCEEDRTLECLSLLEVAERKWDTISSVK